MRNVLTQHMHPPARLKRFPLQQGTEVAGGNEIRVVKRGKGLVYSPQHWILHG